MARKRYPEKFIAGAIVTLEAAGYPHRKGALTRVSKHLKVPVTTLRRWAKRENNAPQTELVSEKRLDVLGDIKELLGKITPHIQEAMSQASFRDLVMGYAILIDKQQLLEGKATDRVELIDVQPERVRRLNQLLETARTRRDGQGAIPPGMGDRAELQ